MSAGRALRRPGVLVAAAVAGVLLLGGCESTGTPPADSGSGAGAGSSGRFEVDVKVDSPELRRLRRSAGLDPCRPSDEPAVDGGMPEVILPCLGGGPEVALASLRGPLVVNLWASWCGPCREELPYYQQLHERGAGKVDVLGVDYQDTQPGQALALAKESGVTFPSVADPAARLRVPFRIRGLPGIVFVDERGVVVHQEFRVIESYEQLAGLVEEHLGVRVGAAG